jgi:tetratricopeptide (TPR) repeat protein
LEKINQGLQAPGSTARPLVFVLLGMGGCGKSQLALEYCHQAEHNGTYSVIFWIDATSPTTAQQSFATAAKAMSKPNFSAADDEGNLQFVRNTLSAWHSKWLLVFDNFDDPMSFSSKSIKEYFPRGGQGSILITGRHEAAKDLGHHIDVSTMSDEEALELLFRSSRVDQSEPNLQEGEKIIKRLGFHALAIDQARAYILARNLNINLYLTHYNDRKEKVLSEAPELWDYKRALKDNPESATKLTVFTTWELSFDLITGVDTTRKDKEHLLTLMAFFNGRELYDTLFEPYVMRSSEWMRSCMKNSTWDKYVFQDILTELRNLSLLQSLQINAEGASFSLHPLIQDWIKLRASSESRQSYAKEAVLVLGAFLDNQDMERMAFEARQTTSAHLDAVLRNEQEYLGQDYRLTDINILDATDLFADFFDVHGRYGTAEELYEIVSKGRKLLLGDEHHKTLRSMNDYGHSLNSQGKYDKAEPIHRQTLALREKAFGTEHPATLTSMNNFASVLHSLGKFDEAEPIFRQILELREKTIGKEHPDTLIIMNNLALLLDAQGKYNEAEPIYLQTLAFREKVLGKEHPDTLTSMNGLASLLKEQGKYNKAEPIFRQTLELREKTIGKEHPDTLISMNNLAGLLRSLGKFDEAEPIFRQTLAFREKVLGKEHPDTLTSMSNLAGLLRSLGKFDEAEPIHRQTLAFREKVLGKEHPATLTSMNNLALLLKAQGKYNEAEPIFRQALALSEKVRGKEHPDTLITLNNLASLLEMRGIFDEAESMYRQALAGREKVLGLEHPDTLDSLYNLADLLEQQNNFGEAEALFRRELRGCEIVYGPSHSGTITSLKNLAALLEKMGKNGEAEDIRRRLDEIGECSEREDVDKENSDEDSEWEDVSD